MKFVSFAVVAALATTALASNMSAKKVDKAAEVIKTAHEELMKEEASVPKVEEVVSEPKTEPVVTFPEDEAEADTKATSAASTPDQQLTEEEQELLALLLIKSLFEQAQTVARREHAFMSMLEQAAAMQAQALAEEAEKQWLMLLVEALSQQDSKTEPVVTEMADAEPTVEKVTRGPIVEEVKA
jgi:hypothetical protein